MEMVDEYGEDNGDDGRGQKAHEANAVKGQRWIVGRFDGGSRPHCEFLGDVVSFGSVEYPRNVWEGKNVLSFKSTSVLPCFAPETREAVKCKHAISIGAPLDTSGRASFPPIFICRTLINFFFTGCSLRGRVFLL